MDNALLVEMHQKIDALYKPQIRSRPKTIHASRIGYPCLRNLVYSYLNWEQAKEAPPDLVRIWHMGHLIEEKWIEQARKIWRIYEQEEKEWMKYNISGRFDGKIDFGEGKDPLLFDIKSVHPMIWQKFNESNPDEWKTLLSMPFHNSVPAQGQMYMILNNVPEFLIIFVNKSNLQEKFVPMPLDFEYAESLIKKAEMLDMFVKANEYPEPIEYNQKVCGLTCNFEHICLPNRKVEGAEFIDSPEIREAAQVYFENESSADKASDAWDYLKKELRGKKGFIGDSEFEFTSKSYPITAKPEKITPAKPESTGYRLTLIDRRPKPDTSKGGDSPINETIE